VITLPKSEGIQIEGEPTTLGALAATLEAKRLSSGRLLSVLINGDESVELQRLIDVMDALKAGGFDNMSIAARKR
jgi:biopolymer transport protein ExbD